VPHAVRPDHVLPFVDQHVEGQAGFLDVTANLVAAIGDDRRDLQAGGLVDGKVVGELTEPVAAVRSGGAAVKGEQQRPARQEVDERPGASFLIRQQEPGRAREWGRTH
jgi:hypothetical protein